MTYEIKDIFGNFKAEVIDMRDWDKLIISLNKDANERDKDIQEIKETLEELREKFRSIKKMKSEGINRELKEFSNQVEIYKKELSQSRQKTQKEFQELEQKKINLTKEIKEIQEQYIIKLDSEILKKIPTQIKPEDLDTAEIIRKFHNRLINEPKENKKELYDNIREKIQNLNLSPKVKFEVLTVIGDDKKLLKILRYLIDALQSGFEIKTGSGNERQEAEEEPEKENKKLNDTGGELYGD